MRNNGICVFVSVWFSAMPALVFAQIAAFTFDDIPFDPQTVLETTSGVDGIRFQTSLDIQVTDLGFYDRDQDGLAYEHPVGIYDFDTRELLVSTTVDSASELAGLFRYSPIAPFTLLAGGTYMVASYTPTGTEDKVVLLGDRLLVQDTDEVDLQQYYYQFSPELVFPTVGDLHPLVYFGPNFRYQLGGGDVTRYDFDANGTADCSDINALATAIATNTPEAKFDLNGDFQIDLSDIDNWLAGVGSATHNAPFINGDATLDGLVNGQDHTLWESNRFSAGTWCRGDFSADGTIDGEDFNIWNASNNAAAAVVVPEPATFPFLALAVLVVFAKRAK